MKMSLIRIVCTHYEFTVKQRLMMNEPTFWSKTLTPLLIILY